MNTWPNALLAGKPDIFTLHLFHRQRVTILSQVCKQTIAKVNMK